MTPVSTDSPEIRFREGDLVFIRQLRVDDVTDNYVRWVNDQEVTEYMRTGTYPSDRSDIEEYVSEKNDDRDTIMLAIFASEDETHIGNIKLGPIDWISRRAELAILIGEKDYWGKGMGTEAIKLTTQYAFDKLNLHKVYSGCYENNHGMKSAFKKAGFSEEGNLIDHGMHEGEYVDIVRFGQVKQ